VERDKEEDGLAHLIWEKTREREAGGGACLTIKTGAELPIGPSFRFLAASTRLTTFAAEASKLCVIANQALARPS
jgi:hypothetical protein